MVNTKIEWTDCVWNPTTGCSKISPGCENCYAERMARRLAGRCGYPADNPFAVTLHRNRLCKPLRWKKPRVVFVNSMGDLFHPDVPDSFVERVLFYIWWARQHKFIVLTKRPERIANRGMCSNCGYLAPIGNDIECPNCKTTEKYMQEEGFGNRKRDLPKNLWIGVSVENQQSANERLPILLQTLTAVRLVSVEPMLGPVDLSEWLNEEKPALHGINTKPYRVARLRGSISWVICGSEAGPGARPMKEEWAESLRDQCISANVPFFYKQIVVNGRKISLPELEGKRWAEFPQTTG